MILSTERLRKNLDEVIWNIEQARITVSEHHIVKLVIVTKYTETDNIRTLYDLGHRAFGESRVQQLEERAEALDDLPLEWHMIGRLQKNKINHLIDANPFLLHSLDSIELAEALHKRLEAKGRTMPALLQINAAREESKAGVAPEAATDIYREIAERFDTIALKGVMTIGAHTDDRNEVRKSFETTYRIYETLQKEGASVCSMGMSNDYELAIKCGSNLVRIGSAIFKNE